jgi:hypothetical protein
MLKREYPEDPNLVPRAQLEKIIYLLVDKLGGETNLSNESLEDAQQGYLSVYDEFLTDEVKLVAHKDS